MCVGWFLQILSQHGVRVTLRDAERRRRGTSRDDAQEDQ